jgi:hypothetical protein
MPCRLAPRFPLRSHRTTSGRILVRILGNDDSVAQPGNGCELASW